MTFSKKIIANQCLLFAALLYFTTIFFVDSYPNLGYLKAFAEAAIVGGIADWFAVTALFKHPLGIKIPHTAIIPNSKSKIGRNLSHFIRENFLSEKYVKDNLNKIDVHDKTSILLIENETAIINKVNDIVFQYLKNIEYKDISSFVYPFIKGKIDKLDINLISVKLLELVDNRNYHQAAFKAILIQLNHWLSNPENEHMVNEEIKELIRKDEDGKNTFTGLLKSFFIGEPKLHKYLTDFIHHMQKDPDQKVIKRVDNFFSEIIEKLRTEPEVRKFLVELKSNLIANIELEHYVEKTFYDIKTWLINDYNHSDSFVKSKIQSSITTMIFEYSNNKIIKRWVKRQVEGKVPTLISQNAELIDNYFIEYLENLDTEKMSSLIEEKVGDDLQYIRINGTVIGGIIGVSLYSITEVVKYAISNIS